MAARDRNAPDWNALNRHSLDENALDQTQLVQPLEPAETVLARYRSHSRTLFWPCVVLVADAGASGYFLGRFAEPWQNSAALGAAILLALLFWLLPTMGWLARRYTVTTRRAIAVHGVFSRERQEVSLHRGFDVTVRRRGLQALFRSGDVTVHSGSEHPLVFRDVPDAGLILRALNELGEEAAAWQL